MLNNKNDLIKKLIELDFTRAEAAVYVELLDEPATHLELARKTGVNRTKVYRIVDELVKRSLVSEQTDDTGTRVIAGDPSTLEVELADLHQQLAYKTDTFRQLLPALNRLKSSGGNDPARFRVQTYEGVEGFKQMLWHELKAKNEIVIFGSGTIEDLVNNKRWAENHRRKTLDAGYSIRELLNPGTKKKIFTTVQGYVQNYLHRYIPPEILPLRQQIAIYNNTVATYWWREDQKVGFEVINQPYADMQRCIFEHYWQIAKSSYN